MIIDDEVKVIIDTGAVEKHFAELNPESFDLVMNTHYHYDHIRGNYCFKKANIMVHTLDFNPLTSFDEFSRYNSLDLWSTLMPSHDYTQSRTKMGLKHQDYLRNMKVDTAFHDKDRFDFGNTLVEVMHTPGHSAGHCCFWFPKEEFLFTGDICMTQAGPWYGEMLADPRQMAESINKVIDFKPPRMASGHNKEILTDITKPLLEYRDRIYKREDRIKQSLLASPKTLDQLAQGNIIYRKHPTPFVEFWEKLMLLKHLEQLTDMGLIEQNQEGYYYTV